jgi:hypothetical protein
VSDPHPTKQHSHKISTDEGITIVINPVSQNTSPAIRDNFEPDSNVTEGSDLHRKKAPLTQDFNR